MEILTSPIILAVLGLVILFLLAIIILALRSRSVRPTGPPPPPPSSQNPSLNASPRFEDLVPTEMTRASTYSVQLQTAVYNLRIEGVKDKIRYIVNGIAYNSLDEIPDAELRQMTQQLFNKAFQRGPADQAGDTVIRQVMIGNQAAIEARTPNYTISIQQQDKQTRFIVNGLTYDSLNEIPDPEMRQRAQELLEKMV